MYSMGYNKASSLRVVRLVMQETGTYNTQYVRPYETTMTQDVVNVLTDRVMRSSDQRITGTMLSGLTGGFIRPQATPEAEIKIVNGWTEKRIRFLLELEVTFNVGGSVTQYVQGYTDFPGVTMNASIAQDMVFYVNSIIQTRKVHQQTPLGIQTIENVSENTHVLASNTWQNMYQPGQQRLLRPEDVFSNISLNHIPGHESNNAYGRNTVHDSRTALRQEAVKSRRSNGLAGTYASSIMDSYSLASSLTEFGETENNILSKSRGTVTEPVAAVDPFLSAMTSITGRVVSNHFTFSELQKLDQNVSNVTNYTVTGPTQMSSVHQSGMTAQWGGTDRLTQVASILSQSIPAVMMDLMLNRVMFKSTNHDITGQMNTVIFEGKSFSNMDLTRNFELFKHRLHNEILYDITFGNSISYSIDMRVDLLGETHLCISLEGQPAFDFVTPSFADNLIVPVITTNAQTVSQLASDFESLTQSIKEAVGGSVRATTSQIITTV